MTHNSSCVQGRDAEDQAFAVTFIERSMADIRLASIKPDLDKLKDGGGDRLHPDHFVAEAARAPRPLENGVNAERMNQPPQ